MHIHGPAGACTPKAKNKGVAVPFPDLRSDANGVASAQGTINLSQAPIKNVLRKGFYFNVHRYPTAPAAEQGPRSPHLRQHHPQLTHSRQTPERGRRGPVPLRSTARIELMAELGTMRVKSGLAEMLKGGVIMDVTTAEQARIAEDAGAVAVMALERVPADIRAQGGVARMADPGRVREIQAAVTIPVMAKCRIGHFVEAEILEALEVDYIDESEVLTPADEEHHVDKWKFKVPFVCGCRNLGEALRRISEGAAMIRTKGEAGTGDIVNAVRHMRAVVGEIRRLGSLPEEELFTRQRTPPPPSISSSGSPSTAVCPVVMFTAGGIATPADAAALHAARRRRRVRGLGDLQERGTRRREPRRSSRQRHTSATLRSSRASRRDWAIRCAASRPRRCGPRSCSRRAAGEAQNVFADDWDVEQSQPGYTWKRMRLARRLGGELLGVSVYELPPGEATWLYHLHYGNEELLLVLDGLAHAADARWRARALAG